MEKLEIFLRWIPEFPEKTPSEKIVFFAYFLISELKQESFSSEEIGDCFDKSFFHRYSNISSYLSKKSSNKGRIFLKKGKWRYSLERSYLDSISRLIGIKNLPIPESSLFPFAIFEGTRRYLSKIAEQIIHSYQFGLYDGCAVLTRRLCEMLIIDCFERHGMDNLIKNSTGDFFRLNELIDQLLKSNKWNLSRNARLALPKIKRLGDLSAHSRRYLAKKSDIDSHRDDLRLALEELILLIDYPSWKT